VSDAPRPSHPRRWLAILIWCLCPFVGFFAGFLLTVVLAALTNPDGSDPFAAAPFAATVWPLTFLASVWLGVRLGRTAWREERGPELTDEAWAAHINPDPDPPDERQGP